MRLAAICGIVLSSVAYAAPDFVLLDMHPGEEFSSSYMIGTAEGRVRVGSANQPGDPYAEGALWLDGSRQVKPLTPAGYDNSLGYAVRNGQIAGYAGYSTPAAHAGIWSDDGENFVDLHPAFCIFSNAYATTGTQQVGEGYVGQGINQFHALMWSGTTESVIDLNPAGSTNSRATGIVGNQQVGYAASPLTSQVHAAMWHGSAESEIDLHPAGAVWSQIYTTDGIHQVGSAAWNDERSGHAVMWSGTAASAIDLHPPGYIRSELRGIFGDWLIGTGTIADGSVHALLWIQSENSVIDLHQYVPAEFTNSIVHDIDMVDRAIVGGMYDAESRWHAVMWTVPEPASLALLAATVFGSLRRRRE